MNARGGFLQGGCSEHTGFGLPTDGDGVYFSLYLKSGSVTFENVSHLFQLSLRDDKVIPVLLVFLKVK